MRHKGDGPPQPFSKGETLRARLLEELAQLSPEQWLTIARRFEAEQPALAASRTRAARAINSCLMRRLDEVEGFQEHTLAFNRWSHERLCAVVEGLPETLEVEGRAVPLRSPRRASRGLRSPSGGCSRKGSPSGKRGSWPLRCCAVWRAS